MSSPTLSDTGFAYIDDPETLVDFCQSLQHAGWIALDTEFIRERTFYPRLCLLQIAVPGNIACIDPLAIDDLSPLFDILYDRAIVKVLHACSQDLEIFACLKGAVPGPIFDTQLAAPLLGFPEQMGYANFVREVLGVNLDKAQTRTDWSHRPLAAAQLSYAADDVRYLAQIYPDIRQRLEDMGRLGWLKSEFEACERLDRYLHEPADAWRRIKGLDKLRPRALAIVQQLAGWREARAQQKDLPRSWVLKDDALLDIGRLAPDSADKLAKIRNLPPRTGERYGEEIAAIVRAAAQSQPEPLPDAKRRAKPTAGQEAMADVLQAQLRLLADRYDINSATLASRKDIVALVQGETDIALLRGWRLEMAGNELLAMKQGRRTLAIENEQLVISERPASPVPV